MKLSRTGIIQRRVPKRFQPWALRKIGKPARLANLRKTTPLSRNSGFDRGTPIDRVYIERFLEQYADDLHGSGLEVKDDTYLRRFGNSTHIDVLDIDTANSRATVFADLAAADSIPSETYDCFVLTQTLQYPYDLNSAVAHAKRILKPGGVVLATVPGFSRDHSLPGAPDYWRFSANLCKELFGREFGHDLVTVQTYGNVLSAMAYLTGMAAEELKPHELNDHDNNFQVIIGVRAQRADGSDAGNGA